jgi:fatty-acid desaturase
LRWYEIDINWLGIRAFQLLGLAHSIKRLRFNRASSTWQLVRGPVRSER